jgi:hypothetical protein
VVRRFSPWFNQLVDPSWPAILRIYDNWHHSEHDLIKMCLCLWHG